MRTRGHRLYRLVGALALASLPGATPLLGCGGGQHFDGTTFRDGKVGFQVPAPPAAWQRIDVTGASLAFRDDAREASILLNGRCGGKDDDTPLPALVNHLVMGTTERDFVKEETIPFDGREARHVVLRAKLDGVLMGYDVFVEKKNGCVYDLVYVAPPQRLEEGAAEFERFAAGFRAQGDDS